MADIKDVIITLDKAADSFDGVITKSQKKIYDEVVALLHDLELDSNKHVKQTIKNLKIITSIKSKLASIANNGAWLSGVNGFLKVFDVLLKEQNAYFAKAFPENTLSEKAKDKHMLMKQIAVQNVVDALTGDGLQANVTNKINDILLRAVTSNAKFTDLQDELRAHLIGEDGGTGALSRYASTYAVTAMSQFTGQNNKLLTQDLDAEWFMYVGSTMETTREFCDCLVKKRYIHRSEFHKILQGDIDGHQCAIYKKTGLPYGMIAETNEDNFQVNVGGWNCRHQLVPVSEVVVPLDIREKFKKEEPKPEPIPEEAYKADLDAFTEYLSKHKSGKVAGVVAQMYEAAEAGDANLLNELIEEAKSTIAKNMASIKSKAALKEAKKKAEEEAKKAAEDAAKQAKLQNMLALAGTISGYQGYIAYQEQMQKIADALAALDEDGLKEAVAEVHKIEADLITLKNIIGINKWATKYTYAELKEADEWLEKKKAKLATWPLEKQESSLSYDVNIYLNKPEIQAQVAAWEVEQETLSIMLADVSKKVVIKSLQSDIDKIAAYVGAHPKSGKVASDLQMINEQMANGQYSDAKETIQKALKTIDANESSRISKKKDKDSIDVSRLDFALKRIEEWGHTLRLYYGDEDIDKCKNEILRTLADAITSAESSKIQAQNSSPGEAEKIIKKAIEEIENVLNKSALKLKEATKNIVYGKLYDIDARSIQFSAYLKEYHEDFLRHRSLGVPSPTSVSLDIKKGEKTQDVIDRLISDFQSNSLYDVNKERRPISENIWKTLTPAEKLVLTKYTQTFSYLNKPLRGLTYNQDEEKISEFDIDCKVLTAALQKCITGKDIALSRGDDDFFIPALNKRLSELKVGDEWIDGGFSSNGTSSGTGFSDKPIKLIIIVPKGSQAMFIEPLSHYNGATNEERYCFQNAKLWDGKKEYRLGREFETLLQRGGKYRTLRVEKVNKKPKITLLLLGQLYSI